MSRQLTIFDALGDKNTVSPKTAGDTKKQALQRYLDKAKAESAMVVKRYNPNGRKTQYFRLDYYEGGKTRSIHIKGGNVSARLSNFRAKKLRKMIERGAELREVLEQLADFNGGTS